MPPRPPGLPLPYDTPFSESAVRARVATGASSEVRTVSHKCTSYHRGITARKGEWRAEARTTSDRSSVVNRPFLAPRREALQGRAEEAADISSRKSSGSRHCRRHMGSSCLSGSIGCDVLAVQVWVRNQRPQHHPELVRNTKFQAPPRTAESEPAFEQDPRRFV